MNDEDRLRQRLHDQVAGTRIVADLDDVAARIGARSHRRDRPLAALAAGMLVVGTLVGFAIGHISRGTTRSVTVAGAGDAPEQTAPTITPKPGPARAAGEPSWSQLFVRTTREGVLVRVYLDPHASPADVDIEVSSADAVSAAALPDTPSATSAIGGVGTGTFGTQEGAPARWVIAHVGPRVAHILATFGNGSDEMDPVHGIAVLAHLGTGPIAVYAIDAHGNQVGHQSVVGDVCADTCSPTTTVPAGAPTLPAPGAEQPADPVAARQRVTQSVAAAFEGSQSDQTMANAIEGGGALTSVFDALRSGSFARQVNEAKTVVDGIVFRSASDAAVEFHSDLGADGTSGPYFADAALVGTGWQVTRASYCQVVIAADAHCP